MAAKEATLQRKIAKALVGEGAFARKIHGGPYVSGMPDVIGCHNGIFIGLEVKRPTRADKVTKLQRSTIAQIIEAGGVGRVITSVDEALEVLEEIEGDT